jgi:hypothetical protein
VHYRVELQPTAELDIERRPFKHLVLPNTYRIIFEVRAEKNTVWVPHVRHQRQNPLGALR